MTTNQQRVEALAQLLRDAADAHHVYEQTLGHRDEDWATWYAANMLGQQSGCAAQGTCLSLTPLSPTPLPEREYDLELYDPQYRQRSVGGDV